MVYNDIYFATYLYQFIVFDLSACSVTKITGRVRNNNRKRKSNFKFTSDNDSRVTYQCKLDDRPFEYCKFIT